MTGVRALTPGGRGQHGLLQALRDLEFPTTWSPVPPTPEFLVVLS